MVFIKLKFLFPIEAFFSLYCYVKNISMALMGLSTNNYIYFIIFLGSDKVYEICNSLLLRLTTSDI
ncbi:MAG: hypothetical protein A2031_03405 [Deltaproteobacteria bacterium RBG_19FT_COMBO_43_11]|nr:MAG: hypothetical protein A2031_03405 [Deltaproteobacteria bacterium RBG_19FT_COMBO_43_11]